MSDKRYLPLWLHRVFNGVYPAALLAGFDTYWLARLSQLRAIFNYF